MTGHSDDRAEEEELARTFREVFLGEGQEPLTDALEAELIARGWKADDLKFAREEGAMYHRRRHSLVFPLEGDDDD